MDLSLHCLPLLGKHISSDRSKPDAQVEEVGGETIEHEVGMALAVGGLAESNELSRQ